VRQRPLTARECADYLGYTTDWIRRAIADGVPVDGGVVKLEAERLSLTRRTQYRIHEDKFTDFLIAIGWKHLPGRAAPARDPVRSRPHAVSR
jgi:hypothetical protein